MLGVICGDVVGSVYEGNNIKKKDFNFFSESGRFTDDSVMTVAISRACCEYLENKDENLFKKNCIKYMRELGQKYINAGYGGTFIRWLLSKNPLPYNSYGNGSAMRVSPVAYVSKTLDEAEILAKLSAEVSHNHPYGIAGAQAVAGSLWIILQGGDKELVKKYVESKYYNLDFKIDDIRENYKFDVSCQGSVPHAIKAFLESSDFEDSIRTAISIGGDSDTIAAIAGGLSEAYFGIPEDIRKETLTYLEPDLMQYVYNFYEAVKKNKVNNKSKDEEER